MSWKEWSLCSPYFIDQILLVEDAPDFTPPSPDFPPSYLELHYTFTPSMFI